MIKVEDIGFARPVGGGWMVERINVDTRGRYTCTRTEDGETFYVSHQDGLTVSVPRHSVAWWRDEPADKASKVMKQQKGQ